MVATTLACIDDVLPEHRLPPRQVHLDPTLFVQGRWAGRGAIERYGRSGSGPAADPDGSSRPVRSADASALLLNRADRSGRAALPAWQEQAMK